MRALGLSHLAATCVVSLTVVTPLPAKSEASSLSLGFSQTHVSVVKEVGYRNWRHRYARPYWRYRYAYRPSYYRPYRRFGLGPGRYFGVGPGAYECYGYDCNW
jgi:hypothetical protein